MVCRDREVRRALEHGQLLGLLRNDRDRLDRRRAGADDRHPLAREVHLVVWPTPGEVHLALEPIGAGNIGHLRDREAAGGHHIVLGDDVAARGVDRPALGIVVPRRGLDTRAEPNVLAQIVLVGHEVGVPQDLGLGGIPLGPGPLGLQLGIPAVGVVDGQDVAPSARVTIPVPGAADTVAGLDHDGTESCVAHPLQLVHASEPRTHDHGVDGCCALGHLDPLRYVLRVIVAPPAQWRRRGAPGLSCP